VTSRSEDYKRAVGTSGGVCYAKMLRGCYNHVQVAQIMIKCYDVQVALSDVTRGKV
jgi:hypothetical protein